MCCITWDGVNVVLLLLVLFLTLTSSMATSSRRSLVFLWWPRKQLQGPGALAVAVATMRGYRRRTVTKIPLAPYFLCLEVINNMTMFFSSALVPSFLGPDSLKKLFSSFWLVAFLLRTKDLDVRFVLQIEWTRRRTLEFAFLLSYILNDSSTIYILRSTKQSLVFGVCASIHTWQLHFSHPFCIIKNVKTSTSYISSEKEGVITFLVKNKGCFMFQLAAVQTNAL